MPEKKKRVCSKCGYEYCGTINTGRESCIFCPKCHVRTSYYPVPKHIDLLEEAWNNGVVFDMTSLEIQDVGEKR